MSVLLLALVILALVAFIFYTSHLLNALMVMEVFVIVSFLTLVSSVSLSGSGSLYVMVLLVVAASAGALGLSILVSLCRTHGRDYFSSYNLLW